MRILAALFLCALFSTLAVAAAPVSGTFRGFQSGCIAIDTGTGESHCFPAHQHFSIVSISNSPLPKSWIYPGDGIEAYSGRDGKIRKIKIEAQWFLGRIAFEFPNRITFQDGSQFLLDSAPVYLNGEKIQDASLLKQNQPVLVRFNSLQNRVVGVWAFDFESPEEKPAEPLINHVILRPKAEESHLPLIILRSFADAQDDNSLSHKTSFLKVLIQTGHSPGTLYAQLLGVTSPIRLKEKKPGIFTGTIPFPKKVTLPGSYLAFASGGQWIYIDSKPIQRYTIPPVIADLEPANGTTAHVNPPFIFISFDPAGSPIDINSVTLIVDGENVTPRCFRNQFLVFFTPSALRPGKHSCSFSAQTPGGGFIFRRHWHFKTATR